MSSQLESSKSVVLRADGLDKNYVLGGWPRPKAQVKALQKVSFELARGETLAVVGESGCGKSTLAKCLMLIEKLGAGAMYFEGQTPDQMGARDWRKNVQMIFQDPYSSINPRKKCIEIVVEPAIIRGEITREEALEQARALMLKVGLRAEMALRYPHMLSGGQRQRIGIARALMLKPRVLICDEPVSALDVSIQAQVLNLLMDLQDEMGLSYVFITHDLSIVKHIADQIIVMYLGQIMEKGGREQVLFNPQHPYTKALLASHPDLKNPKRALGVIEGDLPSPLRPPPGCPFQGRCPSALAICKGERPQLQIKQDRFVACHLPQQ